VQVLIIASRKCRREASTHHVSKQCHCVRP